MGSSSLLLFSLCLSTSVSFPSLSSPASLRVSPDRLQFILLESFSLRCEEQQGTSTGWRVKRNIASGGVSGCGEKDEEGEVWGKPGGSSCNISFISPKDGRMYWCESDSGERSTAVNITVTAGAVILESPVLPVTEEEAVTLRCRYKTTPSDLTAEFYKNGSLIRTESTREMTIPAVSKSDEGLYKCHHSDLGESPEIWLAVRDGDVILESPVLPVTKGDNVTLRCRYKTTPSNLTADFYKNGSLIRTESTREMTIYNVSKSDEGFYKCHHSDLGKSPESWLAVRAPPHQPSPRPPHPSSLPLVLLVAGLSIPLVVAMVILLVVLLCFYKKSKNAAKAMDDVTYSDIDHKGKRTPQKKRDNGEVARVEDVTYADVNISKTPKRKRERPVGKSDPVYSAVRTDTLPDTARAKDDVTYSDINHKGKQTPQKKRDGAVPELVYAAVRTGP